MYNKLNFDLAIIGAGAAGLSLASGASQLGLQVVLIESGKMGGDCLNYGCVPSKALLAAAKSIYQAREKAKYFGADLEFKALDFNKVKSHIKNVIATIEKNDSKERFESLGVKVISGEAKFNTPSSCIVNDTCIYAKHFAIATGSNPFVPPIPGIKEVDFYTNETIFDVDVLPKKLAVIGGGPIGCELAQAFAMLGSEVMIVEAFNILPKDDEDCVEIVRRDLQNMGINIFEQAKVIGIQQNSALDIELQLSTKSSELTISASHVLVATGRRPNITSLDLDKANVKFSATGIDVDSRLRTTNKRVYAMGDVASPYQFTHVASYHASIVLKNMLFKIPAKFNSSAIPWVTYTSPELAHVGLHPEDSQGLQATEWDFVDNDRSQAEHDTHGKIKVTTDKKGVIVGASIVGSHAGELLMPWVMAVREKKTLRTFTDTIVAYPTLSEVSKQVAAKFYKPMLFAKKVRLLVHWLYKLF